MCSLLQICRHTNNQVRRCSALLDHDRRDVLTELHQRLEHYSAQQKIGAGTLAEILRHAARYEYVGVGVAATELCVGNETIDYFSAARIAAQPRVF